MSKSGNRLLDSIGNNHLPAAALLIAVLTVLPAAAGADDSAEPQDRPAATSKASENYYKTDKIIPGEEVVTPTGKKMKVWSTAGPVEVSPPPQPFDDPSKQHINGSQVIVDGSGRAIKRDRGDISGARPGEDPAVRYKEDSTGAATDPFERNTIKKEQFGNPAPEFDVGADPAVGSGVNDAQNGGSE